VVLGGDGRMILGIAHNHELWERPNEIEIFKEMMGLLEEVMVSRCPLTESVVRSVPRSSQGRPGQASLD
jgi:hypothetical protein